MSKALTKEQRGLVGEFLATYNELQRLGRQYTKDVIPFKGFPEIDNDVFDPSLFDLPGPETVASLG
jgi:hypothetical protein